MCSQIGYYNIGGLEYEAQGPLGDNRKILTDSNGDRTRDPKITFPSSLPLRYYGYYDIVTV